MFDYQSFWNNLLNQLRNEFGDDIYDEVLKESKEVYKFENNYLFIIVPNNLIKFRLENFYVKRIKDFVSTFYPTPIGFRFLTQEQVEEERNKKNNSPSKLTEVDNRSIGRNLSNLYRFDNFVVGESNRTAFLTAIKVAENPVVVCNPLYIFGDVGLGKTHLMTSIGNYALDNNINTNVVYTSSQKFTEDYFLATSKNGRDKIEAFYDKYNSADLLLVDDIQFLEGKTATQEEFFKVFEHLSTSGKQIVLTSDRPANDLKNMMARLKSRFSWGISVDITAPNKDFLINILKSKLSFLIEDPKDVSDNVLSIIAESFPNNIRDLEGALRTFVNYCTCMNCPFSQENLYIALERLIPRKKEESDNNKTVIQDLKKVICEYFNVSNVEIDSQSRKSQVSYARQMLMYILRNNFNIPLKMIGENLGKRDHATVVHGIDKIDTSIKTNNMIKNDYDLILKKINK